jgi:hypothetical protein
VVFFISKQPHKTLEYMAEEVIGHTRLVSRVDTGPSMRISEALRYPVGVLLPACDSETLRQWIPEGNWWTHLGFSYSPVLGVPRNSTGNSLLIPTVLLCDDSALSQLHAVYGSNKRDCGMLLCSALSEARSFLHSSNRFSQLEMTAITFKLVRG